MMFRVFRYAAVQSQVRAMRSRLLDSDDWHFLLRMESPADILRYLGATPYGPFISGVSTAGFDFRLLSLSLHDSLFQDCRRLLPFLSSDCRRVVTSLLARYEAENLKTILRGMWRAMPETAIRPLFYRLGRLSQLPIDSLLNSRRIPDAVDLLAGTVFHAPLVHSLEQFQMQNRLFPLEMALDQTAFRILSDRIHSLGGRDRKHSARLTGLLIDGINLQWLIRFRMIYGLSSEETINYTLPGGCHLSLRDIGNLARAGDLPTFLERLANPYRTAFSGVDTWDRLYPLFQTWLVVELGRVFRKDPFHFGLPISYILCKEAEVKALDGLLSALGSGMTSDRIARFWYGCWLGNHFKSGPMAA